MKFLFGKEAAVHKDALLISDLHLGMEGALFERGIRNSEISERLAEKTLEVLGKTGKKELIIVGDVKERVVGIPQEAREYLRKVEEHAEITVVKGNHDGGIERIPGIKVIGHGGFAYKGLGIFHGHAWPSEEVMECDTIVMGHNHPQVKLQGEWHPVWVEMKANQEKILERYPGYDGEKRLVLMPSFNPLLGTNIAGSSGLGPVLKNNLFKINTAIVYTLSGTKLGKLGELFKRL
ncbi:MAG: metallophosphoesterase [Candidatus Micrarchaeia archaeon]